MNAANCALVKPRLTCLVVSTLICAVVSAVAWSGVSPWLNCAVVSATISAVVRAATSSLVKRLISSVVKPTSCEVDISATCAGVKPRPGRSITGSTPMVRNAASWALESAAICAVVKPWMICCEVSAASSVVVMAAT